MNSIQKALRSQQRAFEGFAKALGNPERLVLRLGSDSVNVGAAIIIGATQQSYDDAGAIQRRVPATATILASLLPAWATPEVLSRKGTITANGRAYKIDKAESNGFYLTITAFYWAT